MITTGGVLTGSGIAVRGMARRTQYVRTFDILPLHNNKRVNFGLVDPMAAREIFIREALVAGEWDTRLPFLAHNRKLIAQVEQL